MFSKGFKSEDSAGVFHQFMLLLVMKSLACMEVCVSGHCLACNGGFLGKRFEQMAQLFDPVYV